MMMSRSRGMEMQIEIAGDRKEIVKLFQLVYAQLARRSWLVARSGGFQAAGAIWRSPFLVFLHKIDILRRFVC
jgi:hypothetical protein